MANADARITAVIFDMGGVVVELGPITDILGDDPLPVDVFWERWLASDVVRAYEMGESTVEDFGGALIAEMGMDMTGAELIERFRAWPRGLFPESEQLIADIADDIAIGVLSNTNALHWNSQQDHDRVKALFPEHVYLSFEMGLAKPDAAIFNAIVKDLTMEPGAVLFLDDNQINVDGARAAGLQAELTKGPIEARAVLAGRGLLRD